jgi:hypothetical protein
MILSGLRFIVDLELIDGEQKRGWNSSRVEAPGNLCSLGGFGVLGSVLAVSVSRAMLVSLVAGLQGLMRATISTMARVPYPVVGAFGGLQERRTLPLSMFVGRIARRECRKGW